MKTISTGDVIKFIHDTHLYVDGHPTEINGCLTRRRITKEKLFIVEFVCHDIFGCECIAFVSLDGRERGWEMTHYLLERIERITA